MKYGLIVATLVFAASMMMSGCSKKSDVTGSGSSSGWSPVSGLSLFNGIVQGSSSLYAAGVDGVFRSDDGGLTWKPVGASLPTGNYNVATSGGIVIAGSSGPHGIYFSSDGGASWTPADSGLARSGSGGYKEIACIAPHGSSLFAGIWGNGVYAASVPPAAWVASGLDTSTVYALVNIGSSLFAGTGQGVFVSTDGGSSWTESNGGLADSAGGVGGLPTIESFAQTGGSVFAGSLDGSIYVSTDSGAKWTNITQNIPGGVGSGAYLAAGDSGVALGDYSGAFYSTDGGSTWTDVTQGLPDPVVTAVSAAGGYLYVCCANATVWRRPF